MASGAAPSEAYNSRRNAKRPVRKRKPRPSSAVDTRAEQNVTASEDCGVDYLYLSVIGNRRRCIRSRDPHPLSKDTVIIVGDWILDWGFDIFFRSLVPLPGETLFD